MTALQEVAPRLPPRPFVRAAWVLHRAMYRASGGQIGLATALAAGTPWVVRPADGERQRT